MITTELKGRLGNHLFQYVTCRVVADSKNYSYSIPRNWLGSKLFKNADLGKDYIRQNTVFKEGINKYNPDVFNISDNTHIDGYWQSDKYFSERKDDIKDWFKIDNINIKYENYCVIHLRAQDDYLTKNYLMPIDYFLNAKKYVKTKYPNIDFLIISDNYLLAKKYFPKDLVLNNSEVEDFKIIYISKCKIISNSTFSWWASWLNSDNSDLIIAPNRWMNHNYNKFKENIFYPYDISTDTFHYM